MSGVTLLDVNLLVALFYPDHIHHEPAHDWFADHRAEGWATCPVTESGFVRILAGPGYGGPPHRVTELIGRLRKFCASGHHEFWSDTLSLRDDTIFDPRFLAGHRQITDVYLLGLAKSRRGRLATFDRTIPVKAVIGAKASLLTVIASAPPP